MEFLSLLECCVWLFWLRFLAFCSIMNFGFWSGSEFTTLLITPGGSPLTWSKRSSRSSADFEAEQSWWNSSCSDGVYPVTAGALPFLYYDYYELCNMPSLDFLGASCIRKASASLLCLWVMLFFGIFTIFFLTYELLKPTNFFPC